MTTTNRAVCVAIAVLGVVAGAASARAQISAPRRIVSTSPSITETLFALGIGDRVVGVSAYCRYPPAAVSLPKVGTFLAPDAELIARLRPDLVIIHPTANGLDHRLASLRVPFVAVGTDTYRSVFTSIRRIAGAAGVPARGEALVATITRRLDAVRQAAASRPHPRVLFIVGRRPGALTDLVAIGPGSYLDDLIQIAGGVNVLAIHGQPEYPRISLETVLRLDPDVIVDTVDMGDTSVERARRGPINERLWRAYGMLTAVRTHRVHAATTDALVVPGPRVAEAAEWISTLLRPGV